MHAIKGKEKTTDEIHVSYANQSLTDGIRPLGKLTTLSIRIRTSSHKTMKDKALREITNMLQPKPTAMKVSNSGPRTVIKGSLNKRAELTSNVDQTAKMTVFSFDIGNNFPAGSGAQNGRTL